MISPACPVCQGSDCTRREVIRRPPHGSFTYWICSGCGHGFQILDPDARLHELQLNSAKNHSLNPSRKDSRWPHRRHLVARTIERIAGHEGKVLDIGCSNGAALAAMSAGWMKFGVELCPQTAEVARRHAKADVFCGPIENYRPPGGGFDVITAFAVIEHVQDPRVFIRSLGSWLKPGGWIVLMTGDRESRVARQMQDDWPLLLSPDHLHFFSARSLRLLLLNAGVSIVREEWRYMYDSVPHGRTFRGLQKIKEILGFQRTPVYDHYYCYGKARS